MNNIDKLIDGLIEHRYEPSLGIQLPSLPSLPSLPTLTNEPEEEPTCAEEDAYSLVSVHPGDGETTFDMLPLELKLKIFGYLDVPDLCSSAMVCKGV